MIKFFMFLVIVLSCFSCERVYEWGTRNVEKMEKKECADCVGKLSDAEQKIFEKMGAREIFINKGFFTDGAQMVSFRTSPWGINCEFVGKKQGKVTVTLYQKEYFDESAFALLQVQFLEKGELYSSKPSKKFSVFDPDQQKELLPFGKVCFSEFQSKLSTIDHFANQEKADLVQKVRDNFR